MNLHDDRAVTADSADAVFLFGTDGLRGEGAHVALPLSNNDKRDDHGLNP